MFYYEYPKFEKKHLLKTEMLEQLRDYPRCYTRLLFQGYGNGIVNGCELSWDENRLTVNSGMIYWNGELYFMEKPYPLECFPEDRLRYVIVRFQEEWQEDGIIYGKTEICISRTLPQDSCEMELGRFRLQEGAKLRYTYQNLQDYDTEYDTINIIHVPFAGLGGCTISPAILLEFAKEMMETGMEDVYDICFVMNVLGNSGKTDRSALTGYLNIEMEQKLKDYRNIDCYRELLKRLKGRRKDKPGREPKDVTGRKIMLV